MVVPMNKTCKICNITKDITFFDKNRRKCKDCRKEVNKNYYLNNKDKWIKNED